MHRSIIVHTHSSFIPILAQLIHSLLTGSVVERHLLVGSRASGAGVDGEAAAATATAAATTTSESAATAAAEAAAAAPGSATA